MRASLKLFIVFILVSFITVSCSKEQPDVFDGKITGPDLRKCMCCGGWFIEIEGETYRFTSLPENCEIDLDKENFPLYVGVNWIKNAKPCLGDEIELTRLVKK